MDDAEARAIINRSMADKLEGLAAALSTRTDAGAVELAATLERSARKCRGTTGQTRRPKKAPRSTAAPIDLDALQ
ncbi:MAG: hypothetical protein M3460_15285 [Actinomycetota bacterium]|jgi:hypothetical protein|nr:hypothetical protein [Actinomycetota bacterium]